ncbi:MAG: FKBP-type peptidyl-prolyl cis-trans isomerase [Candidatus Altiarchaeota archaeon]
MDFIKISFTARVKDGPVFDTTNGEVAKKEGFFDEKHIYRATPVVVGQGQVVQGLDEILPKMKVGEEREVEIAPDKGFGMKDPNLLRLVPMKVFKQQKINPFPGMPVELDGRRARVQTVSGGRVRVDFNHELAGKTVVYKVKIEKKALDVKEKTNYLIERSFNSADDFKINISNKGVEIELPQEAQRDKNLLVRKASLAAELFRILEVEDVVFKETWSNPKKKASAEKNEMPKKAKKKGKK